MNSQAPQTYILYVSNSLAIDDEYVAQIRLHWPDAHLFLCNSVLQSQELLQAHTFDLIVVAYRLQDGLGLDIVGQAEDVPVVLLLQPDDPEVRLQAIARKVRLYLVQATDGQGCAELLEAIAQTQVYGSASAELVMAAPVSSPTSTPTPALLQAAGPGSDWVNWRQLYAMAEGNHDFAMDLLKLFVDDSQTHLNRLKLAIAARNFAAIERSAHYLKGASANVGAETMQQAASTLEAQARQQSLSCISELIDDLDSGLAQVQALLQA